MGVNGLSDYACLAKDDPEGGEGGLEFLKLLKDRWCVPWQFAGAPVCCNDIFSKMSEDCWHVFLTCAFRLGPLWNHTGPLFDSLH